jgi:hypothetical protein
VKFAKPALVVTALILVAYLIFLRNVTRKPCDRVCNLSQCGCVETCPHER